MPLSRSLSAGHIKEPAYTSRHTELLIGAQHRRTAPSRALA